MLYRLNRLFLNVILLFIFTVSIIYVANSRTVVIASCVAAKPYAHQEIFSTFYNDVCINSNFDFKIEDTLYITFNILS